MFPSHRVLSGTLLTSLITSWAGDDLANGHRRKAISAHGTVRIGSDLGAWEWTGGRSGWWSCGSAGRPSAGRLVRRSDDHRTTQQPGSPAGFASCALGRGTNPAGSALHGPFI